MLKQLPASTRVNLTVAFCHRDATLIAMLHVKLKTNKSLSNHFQPPFTADNRKKTIDKVYSTLLSEL